MRIYARNQVCAFRFTLAEWGAFSNFQPLAAGPWTFVTSESVYQAGKFGARRMSSGASPKRRRRGRRPPSDVRRVSASTPGWNTQRVDVMRWVLRMKREANTAEIDAVLAATGDRPVVEISTRDPWWGARSVADRYEGRNVLGRLWMELRQRLRDHDPAVRSGAWLDRIRVGCLAGDTAVPDTT